MNLDPALALAGLPIGLIVGLTGMGGGALLTPMLVLGFGIDPLTAVSSDLVASLCMKPVGGAVHLRHGTVRTDVVRWLMLGSIPTAFLGVLILTSLLGGNGAAMKTLLGGALLLVLGSMIVRRAFGPRRPVEADDRAVAPRPWATLLAGALGGLVVGLTSVGSGSLIIAALMIVYPRMSMRSLVGTDLVQAVPLVGSAALAHLLFGDVHLGLTASLLLGSIPGVYLGARFSTKASDTVLKPVIMVLLTASGAKLLGAGNPETLLAASAMAAYAAGALVSDRRRLARYLAEQPGPEAAPLAPNAPLPDMGTPAPTRPSVGDVTEPVT